MGIKPVKQDCPICGKQVQHVNNHVRMSADSQHGGMGSYPTGWDKNNKSVSESMDLVSESGPTEPIDAEPEPAEFELTDHRADARIYKCGCGEELVYHATKCPQCDEPKQWRGVA